MSIENIRILPNAQVTMSTMRDLDCFFSEHINNAIFNAYCYVSLEFVQQYYLKHLMQFSDGMEKYYFTPVTDIPGVYKTTINLDIKQC